MNKIDLSDSFSLKSFEKYILDEMKTPLDFFEKEAGKLRTNRAHPSLVEDVLVHAYGQSMVLKNIASISAADAQTIVIQPFDSSTISDIEKAISQMGTLGSLPRNDGKSIKISLPPMNQERRQELIKSLKKKMEEALVSVRKIRQDVLTIVKDHEKQKKISEDFSQKFQKQLQVCVDAVSKKIDVLFAQKEHQLLD